MIYQLKPILLHNSILTEIQQLCRHCGTNISSPCTAPTSYSLRDNHISVEILLPNHSSVFGSKHNISRSDFLLHSICEDNCGCLQV